MVKYSKELEKFCKEYGILMISIDGKEVYSSSSNNQEKRGDDNE